MEKRVCVHRALREHPSCRNRTARGLRFPLLTPKSSAAPAARVKYCCRDSPRDECLCGFASLLPSPLKTLVVFCPQSRSGRLLWVVNLQLHFTTEMVAMHKCPLWGSVCFWFKAKGLHMSPWVGMLTSHNSSVSPDPSWGATQDYSALKQAIGAAQGSILLSVALYTRAI